jgi:hypothetical protein
MVAPLKLVEAMTAAQCAIELLHETKSHAETRAKLEALRAAVDLLMVMGTSSGVLAAIESLRKARAL